ncbi:NAD(P)/FAD-dependent oxidoreductase [Halorientalis pallida]|uniref:NADH dehydrogenase FAD-containing subunit n=1 Tax=Halorientalis pallida TaxID=2479928 RepID=A0A498L3V8_9EURY|nr:FAD-dependent oxidoreductase [Halorientalis pallida]RXK49534.1 NADH dehydrogenase FAD-containing subunit [Halorientalis pallida]
MQVAVFGAGYAGLTLARRLERRLPPEANLIVVDESEDHLVQHELHRAIRRPSIAEDITVPIADCFDRAEIRRARVTDVDPEAGVATLDGEAELAYDVGAVCLGAATAFYDLPGVEDHATPLKRLDDAERIRTDVLDAFDAGDARIVVGGAGLSGIQVAGELAALAREEGADDATGITLLEQQGAVAPNFPERFQRAVDQQLRDRGIAVQTDAAVAEADGSTITLDDGTELDHDVFVWTGGIRGPDALAGDRPLVRSRLQLAGDTFVVGDAARVVDADGQPVPASAQSAIREARVAAANVERRVEHRLGGDSSAFEPRLDDFQFDSPGWLVSVGDGAVAQVGGTVLTGPAAVALKATVGVGYLTSVGAVRRAVGLVGEELDLDGVPDDAVDAIEDDRDAEPAAVDVRVDDEGEGED